MNISQIRESKYLTKGDVTPPKLGTIDRLTQENLALEGKPEELRWCLHFRDLAKPMVLNSTNAQLIAQILGSEETDSWTGKQVVLFNDSTISFQGKLVGGIRVRAPKNQPKPSPAPVEPSPGEDEDFQVPF